MDELAAAYAAGAVSMREWLAAREPLQRQLDATRRRVARDSRAMVLAEHAGRGGALRERWAGLPLERRRAIIAAVLDRVVVGPGPTRLQPLRSVALRARLALLRNLVEGRLSLG